MAERVTTACWACKRNAGRSVVYRLRPVRYRIGDDVSACSMHLAETVEHMAEPGAWVPVTKVANA